MGEKAMEVVRREQGAMPTSGQGPSTTTLLHDPSRGRTLAALGGTTGGTGQGGQGRSTGGSGLMEPMHARLDSFRGAVQSGRRGLIVPGASSRQWTRTNRGTLRHALRWPNRGGA